MSTCRICGCTDQDCSWCIVLQDAPCSWVEPDLCSACWILATDDAERARIRGKMFLRMARRRSGRVPGFMALAEHGEKCIRVCVRIEIAQRRATA